MHNLDSDSEDELPPGWVEKSTDDGNVYFVNSGTNKIQWTHPRTGRKKIIPQDLPFGWTKTVDETGKTLYVQQETGNKTYVDPRLAFATEEKKHVNDFRQRFDSSTTAFQVLHGIDLSGKFALITLLQPPYIKWIALNSFLLFGVYANLSGLYIWTPDFVNRIILFGGLNESSACDVIVWEDTKNSIRNVTCDDSIDTNTSLISLTACCLCSIIALPVSISVKVISKKILISFILLTTGICCLLINFVKNGILLVIFMQSLMMTTLAIGPIGAYTTDIFPTHLRGMAMCLVMMVGRSGAIFGSNLVGSLINTACMANFYIFGGLLIVCAFISFCLPNNKSKENDKTNIEITKL